MTAHFRFVGDPRHDGHGPDNVSVLGHTFVKNGEPTEVSDETAIRKLRGNSHFAELRKVAALEPEAEPEPEIERARPGRKRRTG